MGGFRLEGQEKSSSVGEKLSNIYSPEGLNFQSTGGLQGKRLKVTTELHCLHCILRHSLNSESIHVQMEEVCMQNLSVLVASSGIFSLQKDTTWRNLVFQKEVTLLLNPCHKNGFEMCVQRVYVHTESIWGRLEM